MIYINQHLINKMLKEAKNAYPYECCGLLVGNNNTGKVVREIYPVENKNKVRAEDRYEIDSKEFDETDREATKKGLDIIGIYHSHPDHPAAPSAFDKECASVWTEYSYIIISVKNGVEEDLKSWCFDPGKQEVEEEELKIKRRDFIIGTSLIAFSFTVWLIIPLIFVLPLSLKAKTSSASISYFFSWGLTGIGIYFAGREGYEYIKQEVIKGFFRKIAGKKNE
jgi:proteasome lid subunit RPN8/RPN11